MFNDYTSGGFALALGSSAPTLKVFRGGVKAWAFAGAGPTEEIHGEIHIKHDLERFVVPTFHIHQAHIIGAPVGDIRWEVEVTAAREGVAFPLPTILSTVKAAGVQYVHEITEDDDMVLPGVFMADIEPDMKVMFTVRRNSGHVLDTFADDVFFFGCDLHYKIGQLATTERNRPYTRFP